MSGAQWGTREADAFAALGRELAPHWAQANPKPTRPQPSNIWTREKIAFLQKNHARMSFAELARALGCTRNAVAGKIMRLGFCKKTGPARRWSASERSRLAQMRPAHSNKEIAAALNRTPHAVCVMARLMGLPDGRKKIIR